MRKVFYIAFLFLSVFSTAQPPSKWFKKFGGSGIDIGYGIKETYNRQYIVVGTSSGIGSGALDAYVILVDSMGQMVWQKAYGGALSDVAKSVVINPVDSGFIFAGYTNSFGNGGYDLYVVRANKDGNLIWQKSFGGMDWDFGNDITLAPDGNVVICGHTTSYGYGKKDGYILKVNSGTGVLMWQKYYGGAEDDELVSVNHTSDGMITFAGTKTLANQTHDIWLLKTNYSGDSIVSKSITSYSTNEKCFDFIEDHHSKLIFCGALDTTVAMTGSFSSYMLKTDITGNFISQVSFTDGAIPEERLTSICNTKNQDFICTTRKIQQVNYKLNIFALVMIDNFTYLNANTFGGSEDEEIFNIEHCSDNGYIMTGYTKSYGAGSEDVFIIKLDSNIANPQSVIGINEINSDLPDQEFYSYRNKLYFRNPMHLETTISVYNISGQIVISGQTNEMSFDPKIKEPGIYFAIMKQGTQSNKLKFIAETSHD
jgi:hypothetical protein